ncbi:MAG: SUMF1/EgtB/PvdO family nonheme iron enzyme [Planctomycetes bacterium]|nr:SUMF1/EgtB/PvdO family nonheme iron enzyme [Planctomycetota bacterium]
MKRYSYLLVAFLLTSSSSVLAEGKKYALLVGVNEYDHGDLAKLDYAVNDAAKLADLLKKHEYDVSLLTDSTAGKPTKMNIEAALDEILGKYKKNDTLIIAFAGHGLQFGKDCYFCPTDAKPFDTQTRTLVSLTATYQKLQESYAGVKLVLVDACRNDGKRGIRGGADDTPLPPKGVGVLMSCSDGEFANEHKELQHGVFFYHVIKGMEGAAKDGDEVTWDSLRAYVKKQVPIAVPKLFGDKRLQHPNEMGNLSGAPPVLVSLGGVDSKAELTNPRIVRARDAKLNKEFEYLIYDLGKGVELRLVKIAAKGKTFTIGSPQEEKGREDNEEQRDITFTDDYYIGQLEITRGQFRRFVEETGYKTEAEEDDGGWGWNDTDKKFEGRDKKYTWKNAGFTQTDEHPVVNVTWNDAKQFCEWMAKKGDGKVRLKNVRLPGEAEWEYACRAGSKSRFAFGDEEEGLAEYGNVADADYRGKTGLNHGIKASDGHAFMAATGKYKPNEFGLYDMHGNAYEWCEDFYGKYADLPKGGNQIQTAKQSNDRRALRGGSWSSFPRRCSAAYRYILAPVNRDYNVGFRVAVLP